MTTATHQRATKDYPEAGIKKGDMYWKWSFPFGGGKFKSLTRPRPSQLTNSKMSGAYAAQENLEDAVGSALVPDEISTACNDCAEAIRGVAEEYQEGLDNMPESLQQGSKGEEIQEKIDALEAYAEEMESAASEIMDLDPEDYFNAEPKPKDLKFEDLMEEEQQAMLDEARELAQGPQLEV